MYKVLRFNLFTSSVLINYLVVIEIQRLRCEGKPREKVSHAPMDEHQVAQLETVKVQNSKLKMDIQVVRDIF